MTYFNHNSEQLVFNKKMKKFPSRSKKNRFSDAISMNFSAIGKMVAFTSKKTRQLLKARSTVLTKNRHQHFGRDDFCICGCVGAPAVAPGSSHFPEIIVYQGKSISRIICVLNQLLCVLSQPLGEYSSPPKKNMHLRLDIRTSVGQS